MKRINVLQFICPSGFFGAEMWILALAKNVNPERINCHLAIIRESEEHNIEIYKSLKSLGIKSHQVKMHGRFDSRVMFRLIKLIREEKIDIIHTHGYKTDILGLIAAKITGIKTISTPHGFGNVKSLKLKMFIRLGCFALKFFDIVAPLSEELKSKMIKIKVPYRKIRFILNGVDLAEIESEKKKAPENRNSNSEEKKIVYIGRLDPNKNIFDLIKTFDLFHKEYANTRLIIIGDGPLRNKLEAQARSMPSHSSIEFLGYRNDRLMFLNECDLFSMTSSSEGIPRSLMEAMAMGLPAAAFRIPGVDKLIIHKKTGLLARFGNMEELKECWEQLLFNGKLSEQIAHDGKDHVTKYFSAHRMAEEYTMLYREMIAGI